LRKIISLQGEWRFALDPSAASAGAAWYSRTLPDVVQLPGATDENDQGQPVAPALDHLTRKCAYIGQAWYQRDVHIPGDWAGCLSRLLLERTKLTRVWIDGVDCGSRDSLTTPHRYDLGLLAPGPHTLTIMVDNASRPPVGSPYAPSRPGSPHQISEHTQTNWNGILGRIELQRLEPVFIDDVQVYPDVSARQAIVRARVGNRSDQSVFVSLGLKAWGWNDDSERPCSETERHMGLPPGAPGKPAMQWIEARLPLGVSALMWDEFSPRFYRLLYTLQTRGIGDQVDTVFGLCEFAPLGTQFAVNGRRTFLRGAQDANVLPATGDTPMDVASWLRLFERSRADGFNFVRFQRWCPPDAAFVAADQLGLYLQPGLPNRAPLDGEACDACLRLEGERILREYGNHPSFVMFAVGDEADLLRHFRAVDNRRLYGSD
jgi:Glycosyl hydrolases family 2, sugar binding domain